MLLPIKKATKNQTLKNGNFLRQRKKLFFCRRETNLKIPTIHGNGWWKNHKQKAVGKQSFIFL
jgi:hypothetical protein